MAVLEFLLDEKERNMNKWNNNNNNPIEMGPCDQEAGDEGVRWGIIKMILK